MNEVTTETKPKGKGMLLVIILVVIAALAVGGYFLYKNGMGGSQSEVVATVDGTEITRADFDRSAAQLSNVYASQGIDTSSKEAAASIREQAINTLVNRQLILNAATEAGTTVSNEAIEAEYQTIVSNMGGEENLSTAIAATGVSADQFRSDLETDLIINAYLADRIGADAIAVTDEEVQAAYDTAAGSGVEGLPPFEEVAEMIRGQLASEKQQAAIAAELERLRGEAKIEVLI